MNKKDFLQRVENKLENGKKYQNLLWKWTFAQEKSLARRKKALTHKKMPLARQKNIEFCAKIFRNCLKMKNFTKSCKKTKFFVQKLRWRAPTIVGVRQRLTVFFALVRQRLICRLPCFLRAPTEYEHPQKMKIFDEKMTIFGEKI